MQMQLGKLLVPTPTVVDIVDPNLSYIDVIS